MSAFFRGLRASAVVALGVAVGGCTWLLRFNDPGGSYAGLTDDHFFYVVRGWQILFGDLPVRDFVDQGAPLYYYVAAAVQVLFGRGTLSELAFSVTVLAVAAALVFWLATAASGSILAGLLGAAFHVQLGPRFYNYPKILVYAVAIPLLWRFLERPTARRRFWLAAVTVVAFLFRHDHGVFVAVGVVTVLTVLPSTAWSERVRHGLLYTATCLALLSPYLVFIQMNGGVLTYARQVSSWAERERARTPIEWPGVFDNPAGVAEAARQGAMMERAIAVVQDNIVAWIFYFELILPIVALVVLAGAKDGFRSRWPLAREKLFTVAVLGLVLDAGFLRSPLESRLADPSVPIALLVAWLATALPRLLVSARWATPRVRPSAAALRVAAVSAAAFGVFILWALFSQDLQRRLERTLVTEGLEAALMRAEDVAAQVRADWRLESWTERPGRPGLIGLSMYVNACTAPDDRVFVQQYMPQVLALARRAFAGGHADLRPGFFTSDEDQELTVERLRSASVPILLLGTGDELRNFRSSFPQIASYVDQDYEPAGVRQFDGRYGTSLLVRRGRAPERTYEPLGWPCFGPGTVQP